LAYQAIQVYYLSYPSKKRERREWWVATKTRRKIDNNSRDKEKTYPDVYQEEGHGCPFTVSTGEEDDVPNVLIKQGVVDPVRIH